MESQPPRPVDDPRVYLAAERTYLAWVRTALGLMGCGFLVARSGLVLGHPTAGAARLDAHPLGVWLGCGIVVFGVCVCVTAGRRHRRYVGDLLAGRPNPELHLRTTLVVAAVLAAAGLAMLLMILTA